MNRISKWFLAAVLILSFSKCTDPKDPFQEQGFDLYGKDLPSTLSAYHNVKAGTEFQRQAGTAMYVDFSAGMYTAFGAPVIRGLMSECFNTILAEQFEVYRLAEEQVKKLQVANSTQLGQLVGDPKQYLDRRAPLQAAVEKIVAARTDALLITDFEEWQNNTEVTNTAYLKIPFSQWLKNGNSISFFIADYKEGAVDKHIYFTVFTVGKASGSSLIDKLRPKLSALPAKFDLAIDNCQFKTAYSNAQTAGLFTDPSGQNEQAKNVLDLQRGYLNRLAQHHPFEYYPLGVNWNTIDELHKEYAAQHQFDDLLRKLYINLSNTDSYTYDEFEIKTFDVSDDFQRFAQAMEVKKHKPAIVKGNNGENKISDDEKNAIALTCYNPDGSIKAAYRYKPVEVPILSETFVLNKALFDNTFHTDKSNTEIGVSFAPGFAANKITNPNGLIKIALCIRKATINTANPVLEKFRWMNQGGIANVGLYESVKNTLESVSPANREIYTYYLKTTER